MTVTAPVIPESDPELQELAGELRRFEGDTVRELERALNAMAAGDFTVEITTSIRPVDIGARRAEVRQLVDVLNSMQTRIQATVDAYESLRCELSQALGDQSCLPELLGALRSLNGHCLTDLDTGLQAMADGDFTLQTRPATHPLRAIDGHSLGQVGDVFNDMLARSRTALRSYDAVREDLRLLLGDRSCIDELRRGLRSLQSHCLRDMEEALEALVEGTALTREIGPVTAPILTEPGQAEGELAGLFNRALARAQAGVRNLSLVRTSRYVS